jgi:serralysin
VDTVNASVSFGPLGYGIENLNLTGFADINGTGNENNNIINGNSGANVLDGGTGADTLNAGDGSDIYYVDNIGDVVAESFNDALGGVDLVYASASHTLGYGIENLTLTGSANINGTGNGNNNIIKGNSGNNKLDGGLGDDNLAGGLGNDTYVVNSSTDVVTEALSAGKDLVNSSVSRTLGANIENLTLTGSSNINGTGNGLANILTGNLGNNILTGNAGIDKLYGGAGNDTLKGGSGNDVLQGDAGRDTLSGGLGKDYFDFNALSDSVVGANHDVISDFKHGQLDKIDLLTIDANSTLAGNQTFVFIGNAAFSAAGQVRYQGGLVQANVGGTLAADFEISVTGLVSPLVASDFVL